MEPLALVVTGAVLIAGAVAYILTAPDRTAGDGHKRPTCSSCGNKCGPQRYSLNGSDFCESCTQAMGLPHF